MFGKSVILLMLAMVLSTNCVFAGPNGLSRDVSMLNVRIVHRLQDLLPLEFDLTLLFLQPDIPPYISVSLFPKLFYQIYTISVIDFQIIRIKVDQYTPETLSKITSDLEITVSRSDNGVVVFKKNFGQSITE